MKSIRNSPAMCAETSRTLRHHKGHPLGDAMRCRESVVLSCWETPTNKSDGSVRVLVMEKTHWVYHMIPPFQETVIGWNRCSLSRCLEVDVDTNHVCTVLRKSSVKSDNAVLVKHDRTNTFYEWHPILHGKILPSPGFYPGYNPVFRCFSMEKKSQNMPKALQYIVAGKTMLCASGGWLGFDTPSTSIPNCLVGQYTHPSEKWWTSSIGMMTETQY